ncbi:type IV toxin-antitoxin system AbiEi family antitoxin domain-containing protein [Nisaea sediminum]|uniref:type IV toxin-antitoxin system AbiEi family antitoxin domain-containing protein n=1 Tax=Nisaea sediminum TaxID=2775867 RepID=UPI00186640B2|nr:type IV toxin-antitoxin system AbiEi family antitoxin [Nisaea sediminum]
MLKAQDFITNLMSVGRYNFTIDQLAQSLNLNEVAARKALARLSKRGEIASPARGFYIVVPPEYRRLGSLPADQFIPDLMQHVRQPYYVGLLSAAEYHGAAHQRPQTFQVMVEKNRRPIACGKVKVNFIARKNLKEVPVVNSFSTQRGPIRVASVEATALDIVGYPQHAGGLDNIATILEELSEKLDPQKLVEAAKSAPISWAQRLGYLLEHVGAEGVTGLLQDYVRTHAKQYTPLLPSSDDPEAGRDKTWKIVINAEAESEA